MGGPNWASATGQPIGWSEVNEDEVLAGVKVGLDAGVNHWDNADIYGNGRAERLLAKCFRKLGVNREGQIVATKVGHFKGTALHAYEPSHIRNQCEQSLRNLQATHIDLYYFHHGTYQGLGYDGLPHDYLAEAAGTMHELVKEGKVRAIGQSAYTAEDFERAVPVLKPDVLQNKANLRYDEFVRPGGRCQKLMDQYGCSFVAFGPLDQGVLLDKFDPERPPAFGEGDYRHNRKDFTREVLLGVRRKLAVVREQFGISGTPEQIIAGLSAIAQRWLLAHPHVCSTIPGFRNAKQAASNISAATAADMTPSQMESLRQLFAD